MTDNIEDIIIGCRRNDSKAQRLLYEKYSSKMYGVCLRYSGSADDAKDVLHDGFLKVFEKIEQFQARGAFEGWMRRIMVNTALEKYRNQYKIINIHDNFREYDQPGPEDLTENLTAHELLQFIQELSPKYRIVFNMYAIEGYSHKEISDILKVTEGTSKSNLSRARAILQEKVKIFYYQSLKAESSL